MFARNVVKIFYAGFFQSLVSGFQRGAVFEVIIFHASGNQERILHGAVFHEHDGRVRMRRAEFADKRFDLFLDFTGDQVGQAIEDINGRIEFGEQVGHLGFHFSVAGKTEVDGRPVETATENRAVHHAGARGGKSLQDGSAIKNNWLAGAWAPGSGFFNGRARWEI